MVSGTAWDPGNYTISKDNEQFSHSVMTRFNIKDNIILTSKTAWYHGIIHLTCKERGGLNPDSIQHNTIRLDYTGFQDILPLQLLITEIMADPEPVTGLPAYEYIEVFNPTLSPLHLGDLQIQFESTSYSMDTAVLLLNPGEYMILCEKKAINDFRLFGKVHGLNRWPSIRNTHGTLSLVYKGISIHSVTYDDNWYQNSRKKNGGWSLEMINTANVCDGPLNWKAADAIKGGSPGQPNSVMDTNFVPDWSIDSLTVNGDFTLEFKINKQIQPPESESFEINPMTSIHSVHHNAITGRVELKLASQLQRGIVYQLSFTVKDCTGFWSAPIKASFIKNEIVQSFDLIINEILFNPVVGGYDYVEVFNRSDKVVSTQGWVWSSENNGQKRSVNSNRWIFPGEYFVFTPEPDYVLFHYKEVKPEWLIGQTLPGLPDESGQLTLYTPTGTIIDSITYHQEYHSTFLNSTEGVALERIAPPRHGEPVQWHSAAGIEGYGTPTRINSKRISSLSAEYFKLGQKVFSPDADGYEDYLQLQYSLPGKDYLSRIYVYNDQGRLIKRLADNLTLSHQGNIEWDGKDERHQLCPAGIYILNIEALSLDGKSINSRLTAVLALR